MRELSLNVLDIVKNSVTANATLIEITVELQRESDKLTIQIKDNGKGMSEEMVSKVTDPFVTTRTTRKVGMGIPLFKYSAESTGGSFAIESKLSVGTTVTANYMLSSIDRMPLGDITETVITLIQGSPEIDFIYAVKEKDKNFTLDTREIKETLQGISIASGEVLDFLRSYISENTAEMLQNI